MEEARSARSPKERIQRGHADVANMEENVALSLCELACMKVIAVVAVLFQRAWLVRCTESAVPAAHPPPFDSNGVCLFFLPSPQNPKKGHYSGTLRSINQVRGCVPLRNIHTRTPQGARCRW